MIPRLPIHPAHFKRWKLPSDDINTRFSSANLIIVSHFNHILVTQRGICAAECRLWRSCSEPPVWCWSRPSGGINTWSLIRFWSGAAHRQEESSEKTFKLFSSLLLISRTAAVIRSWPPSSGGSVLYCRLQLERKWTLRHECSITERRERTRTRTRVSAECWLHSELHLKSKTQLGVSGEHTFKHTIWSFTNVQLSLVLWLPPEVTATLNASWPRGNLWILWF